MTVLLIAAVVAWAVAMALVDARTGVLPHRGLVVGLGLVLLGVACSGQPPHTALAAVRTAALVAGPYAVGYCCAPAHVGGGDVKYLAILAGALGVWAPTVAVGVLLVVPPLLAVGVMLLMRRRRVPYGPALCAGFVLALVT